MNQADLSKLVSALRIAVKPKPRRFSCPEGPAGRLEKLRATVTALVKYERIELNHPRAEEAQGYAERLISDAIRNGDCHKHTMEMADYWLNEKQLVHKLFKVLVPRYQNYNSSFTRLVLGPKTYPGYYVGTAILELKGNPFPALQPETHNYHYWLHNVLLEEAKKEFRSARQDRNAGTTERGDRAKVMSSGITTDWSGLLKMKKSNFRLLLLIAFYGLFLILGAAIFSAIESPLEVADVKNMRDRKNHFLRTHSCITDHLLLGVVLESGAKVARREAHRRNKALHDWFRKQKSTEKADRH
uniref:Large ribosomal subunit protein bL17m n=1 Tax=Daphnia magna TaxID=35525 RepID=A0A4Y7MGM6_9CRUS|nr:EOG090X0EUO [Daphnia magna]SVE81618.1 EOG090X0EUO [Daphnia magna]SVE82763.1 EOG090X0EUO [Daphnia magna]